MANPKKVLQMILHCLSEDQPIFIKGKPGEGKSDVANQAAKLFAPNVNIETISLASYDSVDFTGLPSIQDGRTTYARPIIFPTEEEAAKFDFWIMFFDEANTPSSMAIFHALYRIVLDREINGHKLPSNVRIIAAGNKTDDKSYVQKLPAALSNRFTHIKFESNVPDWQEWARQNGIDEVLIDFAEFRPDICKEQDLSADAFCTRRSLAVCNKHLHAPEEIRFSLLEGTIGPGAAGELLTYFRIRENLPPIASILVDPNSFDIPEDKPDLMFALCMALADKVDRKTLPNFARFVRRMPADFTKLAFKSATDKKPELKKTQEYIDHEIETKHVSL